MENTVKMLVTQALDERDLLAKKINDKIQSAVLADVVKNNEDTVYNRRLSREEFRREAESAYQQILDLIERYNRLEAAIVESNANTYIETSYGRFSVAGAITLRNRMRGDAKFCGYADFESTLLIKLKKNYHDCIDIMERKNKSLAETAEEMRLSILGREQKNKDDKPLAVVETYIKENTMELADPLDIVKKMEQLQERKDKLLNELETQIKVSNATTFISV
ncbi:MAG: hypothetical protein IJ419_09935 [Agathobacter sp.]|nr:hypothetical protein [Agathobacter sp.]